MMWVHENHSYWIYDDRKPCGFRENTNQIYNEKFTSVNRLPLTYYEEGIIAASLIAESTDLPLGLLLSGGGDSEIVGEFLLAAGVPFKAWTMSYNNGKNDYDLKFAINWCQKNKIEHDIIDIDLYDLIQTEWANNLKEFVFYNYQIPYTWIYKYVSSQNYLPLSNKGGAGFSMFKNDNTDWFYRFNERTTSFARYGLREKFNVIPQFFRYTPELLLSFLKDPLIQEFLNNPLRSSQSSRYDYNLASIKQSFYKKIFPQYIIREKMNGFENLEDFNQLQLDYTPLSVSLPTKNQNFFIGLNEIIETLEQNNGSFIGPTN